MSIIPSYNLLLQQNVGIPKAPETINSIERYAPSNYNNHYTKPDFQPHPKYWIDNYFKMLHILAVTFDGSIDCARAMKCMIQNLAQILPNKNASSIFKDFILMTPSVINTMENSDSISLNSFFVVNSDILKLIKSNPKNFFDVCFTNSELLFVWTYLLLCYYDILQNKQTDSFNSLKQKYAKDLIAKETWGNAVWFVIHHSSYYSPLVMTVEWQNAFKAFISTLQIVIPCSLCRNHLRQNLPKNDINKYINNKHDIFKWTHSLHNIVNESCQKPTISLEDAKCIYDPYLQPFFRQNTKFSNY